MGSDGLTVIVSPANPPLVRYLLLQAALHAAPQAVDEVGQDVLQVQVHLGGALQALPPDGRPWLMAVIFWFCCGLFYISVHNMQLQE